MHSQDFITWDQLIWKLNVEAIRHFGRDETATLVEKRLTGLVSSGMLLELYCIAESVTWLEVESIALVYKLLYQTLCILGINTYFTIYFYVHLERMVWFGL